MTNLQRVTGKIFGETATATGDDPQIGQFGSALAGTYVGTTDVATIQNLSAWSNGFIDAVTPSEQFPPLPEMTGFGKVLSHQIAYILQKGTPEWDSGTTYYIGDFAKAIGEGKLYVSKTNNNINNALSDEDYWEEFSNGNNGMPIGTIFSLNCTASYVPEGALPCDGTEYTKAQFPDLWANYLNAQTPLLDTCSYADYATAISNDGFCAKFAIDTTNETFKVPTIINKFYQGSNATLPVKGNGMTIGLTDGSNDYGLNIDRTAGGSHTGLWAVGATNSNVGGTAPTTASVNINVYGGITTDATKSGIIADSSNANKEITTLRYFVQVANGQINQSMMDWAAWASSLAGKLNADHTNDTKPYLKTTYVNGTSGYNIWSNGYCEQWGFLTADATVSFLKIFVDTNYYVLISNSYTSTGTSVASVWRNKTTTSVDIDLATSSSGTSWKVGGYLAEGEY
ncbi:MAG: hypothetical protein J6T10_26805 [Methanobrevibacter sp.]|nr:hypothetical protein [Methanobrevibacter sp.]